MDRPDIILLLFQKNQPIIGTTRVQKLVFLAEKETKIFIEDNFDFRPYLFGPASDKVYDDLNFLENLGYIERSGANDAIRPLNIDEIENYSASAFLSSNHSTSTRDSEENYETFVDANDQIVYKITKKGIDYLNHKDLLTSSEGIEIQKISKKFTSRSLSNLLQYVYSNYPDYTVESIIKDKIS